MAFNTTKVWKTAAYIRLSREDVATKNGERAESESVVNQQQIISDFITSQPDLGEHLIFIDDGATGTNFDRTGFQSMMQEIHAGNINCVVVKDLSRFGRNYTEAGVYMEQVFPMLGVRFIAINDHVDSFLRPAEMDSILIPLKNLLKFTFFMVVPSFRFWGFAEIERTAVENGSEVLSQKNKQKHTCTAEQCSTR